MWKIFKKQNEESSILIIILRFFALFFVFFSLFAPWIAKFMVYNKLNTRDGNGKVIEMLFSEKIGSLGTLGDWFGGSTLPWLTFATTFLLIENSIMQRRQIRLQKQEMQDNSNMQRKQIELQKQEMKKTNEEFALQNQTLSIQRFENTFFNMLSLHNQLIDKLTIRTRKMGQTEATVTGRAALRAIFERFSPYYEDIKKELDYTYALIAKCLNEVEEIDKITKRKAGNFGKQEILRVSCDIPDHEYALFKRFFDEYMCNNEFILIINSYDKFYKKYHNELGHYFRSLYRIIKYVEETDLIKSQEEKEFYTDFIRAQFSSFEQVLLLYNCLSDKGFCNFLPLLKKYNLLDGLDKSLLFVEEHYNGYIKYSYYPTSIKREQLLELFIEKSKLYQEMYSKKHLLFSV